MNFKRIRRTKVRSTTGQQTNTPHLKIKRKDKQIQNIRTHVLS